MSIYVISHKKDNTLYNCESGWGLLGEADLWDEAGKQLSLPVNGEWARLPVGLVMASAFFTIGETVFTDKAIILWVQMCGREVMVDSFDLNGSNKDEVRKWVSEMTESMIRYNMHVGMMFEIEEELADFFDAE